MRVAVENSTWNNIGDAFYQMSLENMLREALPDAEVFSFDGPLRRAFRPNRHIARGLDSRLLCEADHYVFSGPILGSQFLPNYGELIEHIVKRGKTYSLLSIHDGCSSTDQRNDILQFLRKHPPAAVHSRDNPSFETIGELCSASLRGICFAFFISKVPGISGFDLAEPYICSSFHSGAEPSFYQSESGSVLDIKTSEFERIRKWRWIRHTEFRKHHPTSVGRWKIYRPVHSFNRFPHLIFSRPDSFISYNPKVFLSIYKCCDAVFTDRVHAGVAALSFGRPAHVIGIDNRFDLFDAVGLDKVNGFFLPNDETLAEHYQNVMKWLRTDFLAAIS